MTPMRVIVVGAGIAGLTTAYRARETARAAGRELDLLVVEAGERAGGNVATRREHGFLIEAGPNGFVGGEPAMERLLDDLGLTASAIATAPTARRFVLRNGRLRGIPASPGSLLTPSVLTLGGRLRLLLEPWARPAPAEEESVFDFAVRRFGRETAEVLADAIVAGMTGGESAAVSMQAAFPAVSELERRHGSVARGLLARRGERRPTPRLLSFGIGMAALPDALADALEGALRTRAEVVTVAPHRGEWRVTLGGGEVLSADRVVVATPAWAARPMFSWNPAASEAVAGIGSADLAVVTMAWPVTEVGDALDGYGYLVPGGERLATLGVVFESSILPDRAPPGWVLVRAMVGGTRAPWAMQLPDEQLLELTWREASKPLGLRRGPGRHWISRHPRAIPQYTPGHRDRVARARAALARTPGLQLCGTSYDGIALSAAVRSGETAAQEVLAS
jgi:oxygen-dependent protoporphyrinogen oxidase